MLTPSFWSYHLLWGVSTDIRKNFDDITEKIRRLNQDDFDTELTKRAENKTWNIKDDYEQPSQQVMARTIEKIKDSSEMKIKGLA
jgi:DNA-binding ferritin-like protein